MISTIYTRYAVLRSLKQAGKKPEIAREPGLIFFKIVREIFKTVREHLSAGPKGRFTSTPEGPRSRGMARGVGLQGRGVPFPYARIFFLFLNFSRCIFRPLFNDFFILFTFYSVFIFSRAVITRCGPKGRSARGRGPGEWVSPSPGKEFFYF